MHSRSRLVRNVFAAALIAGLVAGTVIWQTDDTWPLAQMRMFPGGGESAISIVDLRATFADGTTKNMNPFVFHLKRADIEGQMDRVRANPRMIEDLITAYNPHVTKPGRRIVAMAFVRRVKAKASAPWTEKTLARWPI